MRRPTPLKRAIFESRRTQRDIADAVGITPSHLSRIVNGLHVDDGTQEKIASELGRNVSDLFPFDEAA